MKKRERVKKKGKKEEEKNKKLKKFKKTSTGMRPCGMQKRENGAVERNQRECDGENVGHGNGISLQT